ncbi:hypothetical protein K1719_002632 [Acacia pycnantha]|nr:hypothetical protein K1719_002632 [Acacia pycnantha]
MQHTVPFESSLKNDPPPHPGEDHSTKRAKTEESAAMDSLDTLEPSPPAPGLPSGSALECVPETHMDSIPPSEQDVNMKEASSASEQEVNMGDNPAASSPKIPSFKDKLLNSDSNPPDEEEDDFVLDHGDVSIGFKDNVPSVEFAPHVLKALNQKMGLAVIVKLLGRKIGFRQLRIQLQNIWKPSGPLKLTDLDDDCFLVRPTSMSLTKSLVGFGSLDFLRYYHKSIIRSIGSVFGEVIKVDYNTDSGDRGKFARLAVNIDLTKPLISKIQVDGETIFVEYEGLPTICFNCGRYGHFQADCPGKMVAAVGEQSNAPIAPAHVVPEREPLAKARSLEPYGEWMVVQRRQRHTTVKPNKQNAPSAGMNVATTSRYKVLNEVDPLMEERQTPNVQYKNYLYQKPAGPHYKKKGKETKGASNSDTDSIPKKPVPQHQNQDCVFNSPHYIVRPAPTILDENHHSAISIQDPRLPQRVQGNHVMPSGPSSRPSLGNDPLSNARGFKLASGVTIHNLGAKPNSNETETGPPINYMKAIASEVQGNLEVSEPAMIMEGADKVIRKLGFQHSHRIEATGFSSGIWILWSSNVSINFLENHVQFIHMEVNWASYNSKFLFTTVYGNPQKQFRNFLWQDLEHIANNLSSPWLLAGKRKRRLFNRIGGVQTKLEDPTYFPSDFLIDLESSLKLELEEVCFQEELLWIQKSSSDWTCLGDRNTHYFHTKALMRRKRNRISQLKSSDYTWLTNDDCLANHARQFFKALYSLEDPTFVPLSARGMFPSLTDLQLQMLEREVTLEEVKQGERGDFGRGKAIFV